MAAKLLKNLLSICFVTASFSVLNPTSSQILLHTSNLNNNFYASVNVTSQLPEIELEALRDIFFDLDGDNWSFYQYDDSYGVSWEFDSPDNVTVNPCEDNWRGVVCDCDSTPVTFPFYYGYYTAYYNANESPGAFSSNSTICHVIELNLQFLYLHGQVPSSLSNLNYLTSLNLQGNYISGSFPRAVLSMSQLRYVNINWNEFTGTIPSEIGYSLPHLKAFNLGRNYFYFKIPDSIGLMSNMSELVLRDNNLNGSIPSLVFELTQLKYLTLRNNQLSGTLSDNICQTSPPENQQLLHFDIANNLISGTIPTSLFTDCWTLEKIALADNRLSGSNKLDLLFDNSLRNVNLFSFTLENNDLDPSTVPHNLQNLDSLQLLSLSNCNLYGTIPQDINLLTQMLDLRLSNNDLTGAIPHSITELTLLTGIKLAHNNLIGEIPSNIGVLSELRLIDLRNNQITGTFPKSFRNLTQLHHILLFNNHMYGTIPSTLFNEKNRMNSILLQNNHFSGQIVVPLVTTSTGVGLVENFDVGNNLLTGTIPANFFTNNRYLSSVSFSKNCFVGSLPLTMCHPHTESFLTVLAMDGLSVNCPDTKSLGGTVPSCLFSMPVLETLHLSGNGMTGSLPHNDTNCLSLIDLSLSHNELRGDIPLVLQQKSWVNFDLSYNKLNGVLSSTFAPLNTTKSADVSISLIVNRLSGKIPPMFRASPGVSILQGSLFDCDYRSSTLPKSDNYASNYSCGTSMLNVLLYIWLGLWFSIYAVNWFDKNVLNVAIVKNDTLVGWKLLSKVRRICVYITLAVVLILMPIYIYCSVYYKNYEHSYAWIVSGVYLSGETSAILMGVIWFGLLFGLYLRFEVVLFNPQFREHILRRTEHITHVVISNKQLAFTAGVVLSNIIIMLAANIAYIYIELYFNNVVNAFAQIALACFKLGWNNYCLPRSLKLVYIRPAYDENKTEEENNHIRDTIETNSITVETILNVFNNIIAPCIATMGVSVNCFYNLIVPPPSVHSTYNFNYCSTFPPLLGYTTFCRTVVSEPSFISYDPPFSYSYQCSSTLVTSYIAVFVYTFLADAFINPVVSKVSLALIRLYYKKNRTSSNIMQPLKLDKSRFVIGLINNTAILLTFGVLFPPLAVIICYSTSSDLTEVFEQLQTFLSQKINRCKKNEDQYMHHLNHELSSVSLIVSQLLWMLFPVVSAFYCFLLFDILGDTEGWKPALKVSLLIFSISVAILWGVEVLRYIAVSRSTAVVVSNKCSGKTWDATGIELSVKSTSSSSGREEGEEEKRDEENTVGFENETVFDRQDRHAKLKRQMTIKSYRNRVNGDAEEAAQDCCQTLLNVWFR